MSNMIYVAALPREGSCKKNIKAKPLRRYGYRYTAEHRKESQIMQDIRKTHSVKYEFQAF